MMRTHFLTALVLVLAVAGPAFPCSFVGPHPVPTPEELVRQADVIVRVRARAADDPGSRTARILVRFDVLEVLKGSLPEATLSDAGYLENRDDANGGAVPYTFIRRGGTHGDCHARNYRAGGEYLFFMRRTASGLTPHWAALKPANEQIFGDNDRWVTWVRQQLVLN
jgi:hypothetical protein